MDDNRSWQQSSDANGVHCDRSTSGSGAWDADRPSDFAFTLFTNCPADFTGNGNVGDADPAEMLAARGPRQTR